MVRHEFMLHPLYPLHKQQELLLRLNMQMPKGLQVPTSWIKSLDATTDHVQSVQDLECFYVVRSTLEETWNFNQKLIELTQPVTQDSGFCKDDSQLQLHKSAWGYTAGIYRVRINLVDNWSPDKERSVDDVRRNAATTGKLLAGIEAVGAYGLQDPALFQSQDGKTLPYCDLAGLQQGDGFAQVPDFSLWWWSLGREARFGVRQSDEVTTGRSAPSLVEC